MAAHSLRYLIGLWAGLLAGCAGAPASAPPTPRWAADSASVQVAAGPQYAAHGTVWRYFWGAHYREVWATPVTAPVLRLEAPGANGLLPIRAGGSYQSHTLHLRTTTGTQLTLRSVDKDGSIALPAWLRGALGGLMRDQTSAGMPYGAYAAARLAETAGVYHANPRLVYLPADRGLGAFRANYANALYLLEERPEGDQRTQASFGNSRAVVSTARMLRAVCQRPTARVEARAYLRARLLDLWLGDWSRREDQWRWASFPQPNGSTRFRPIPRDRDQAFFCFDDGLITRLVAWLVPKYQSFHTNLPPDAVEGLSRTARALDRTLLSTLSADDFRQEADSLCRRLTNAAIADAFAATPPEVRHELLARLGPRLRARRTQLPTVAQRYFQVLAQEAWLVGTDQSERFVVSGTGAGRVRVEVKAMRPGGADSLVAVREYDQQDTHQVNVYGLAGDDIYELHHVDPHSPPVHLFGGAGHTQLISAPGLSFSNITWETGPADPTAKAPVGVKLSNDRHADLTANTAAWMTRYNLKD